MLRVRPYRKDDAKTIVTWCKDEETFYKWSAGIMGEYPLTVQRLEEATSDNLYALSELFQVPIDAIVRGNRAPIASDAVIETFDSQERRLREYYEKLNEKHAA